MSSELRKRYFNLPNYITLGRVVAVLALMGIMLFMKEGGALLSFIAAAFFLTTMLSDLVDGYYARKYNITSTFGKFFDPLADKLIFLVAMVLMIPLERIPAWMVALFMLREIIVSALRSVAIDEGIIIAANRWGKYKTAFTTAATAALLIHYPLFGVEWRLIGWCFLWPALILSIGSGVHYTWGFVQSLRKKN